ncbi:hypothetical protein [Fulvimarina endophytica]|nr:hypothetical protein [Fulvimarina endophytica]
MRLLLLATAGLLAASTASATENRLIIDTTADSLDTLVLAVEGNDNGLDIRQTYNSSSDLSANAITIDIRGDRNGGREGLAAKPLIDGLPFGSLLQQGYGNAMTVEVVGSDNLFASAQRGANNTLSAFIEGRGNQASVSQIGSGNIAGFSQVGNGNMVSISQQSW